MPCVYLPGPAPAVTVANNTEMITKQTTKRLLLAHLSYSLNFVTFHVDLKIKLYCFNYFIFFFLFTIILFYNYYFSVVISFWMYNFCFNILWHPLYFCLLAFC
jgi:hypothetical protein